MLSRDCLLYLTTTNQTTMLKRIHMPIVVKLLCGATAGYIIGLYMG